MIQESLFAMPDAPIIPPTGTKPPALAEPLGTCCKRGCTDLAVLKSPGGSIYCKKHGYCGRRTCLKSVEKFVWHERMQIWCCSCIIKFEGEVS